MYQVAVIVLTGYFALHLPRNSIRSNVSRFQQASKSLWEIQDSSQIFVDESGASWKALCESGGFCNQIYTSVANDNTGSNQPKTMKILKIYSDLAMKRMRLSGNQDFEQIMGEFGIGPTIVKSTEKFVIMERLAGRVLSNEDLLSPSTIHFPSVARTLSKLHCLENMYENEGRENMLWSGCNVLLEKLHGNSEKLFHMYSTQLRHQQLVLEALHLPLVLGHGDFKPSNVVILDNSGDARLIDWETCGCHYRAYDMAKFFRGVDPDTKEEHQLLLQNHYIFVKKYCEYVEAILGERTDDPIWVSLESRLLLPMTWLEAALFFHSQSYNDGTDFDLYTHYAEQRLIAYRKSLKQWRKDLNEYQSLSQERKSN